MKDRVFAGRDVREALEVAGRTLGLDPQSLRYVVLERETPGGPGQSGTPARVAILFDSGRAAAGRPAGPLPGAAGGVPGLRAGLPALVRLLAETAGIELTATLEETDEGLLLTLGGPDGAFFLEEEGEVIRAFEHLAQKMAQSREEPRPLRISCEGWREARDEALRQKALALAAEVRRDGLPRRTGPLNSYERRIVHLALSGQEGIETWSVGEGSDRRVTVAPAGSRPADGGSGG